VTATPASVVIVSRGRPEALTLCLTGVGQMRHPLFEVVVVADPAGLAALEGAGWTGMIKVVPFDEANISMARNLGIGAAAGEILAFLDDDAVPEPTWLAHLTAPFADPAVQAATGFVRGRNGISFQYQARDARPDGTCHPLQVDPLRPTVLTPGGGTAIKTEGTNMAFRRRLLAEAGGFDPVFRFYLDETDLNLRLRAPTAIVPQAQVHHGFAASDRRRADRVPRDLTQIGASLAAFLRRHFSGDPAPVLAAELAAQRRRMVTHAVAGRIDLRDVERILSTFQAGREEGQRRTLGTLPPLAPPEKAFLRLATPDLPPVNLAARSFHSGPVLDRARALAGAGHVVSVILLSPTARPHRVRFHPDGFWLQTGGLFGRSDRMGGVFRFWRFDDRVRAETARVAAVRTGLQN
jgi:O-antigen biosynthesis protein